MDDSQRYIQHYLNSKTPLLYGLLENYLKSTQAGDKFYYEELINDLLNDSVSIINQMNLQVLPLNNFFNTITIYQNRIYFLKDYNYFVYKLTFNISYKILLYKIKLDKVLDKELLDFAIFLIETDSIKRSDRNLIYNYFLKKILIMENQLSNTETKMIFLKWVKNLIKSDVKIEIKNKNRVSSKSISFSEKDFNSFLNEGNYKIILTSYKACNTLNFSKQNALKQNSSIYLKDELLANYLPGYYQENKTKLSYQFINEIYAMKKITKLFRKLSLEFDSSKYVSKIEKYKKYLQDKTRIYKNNIFNINDLFEQKILKDEILLNTIKEHYDHTT